MTDDLLVFLRARLEEDERIARAASGRDDHPASEPERWHWECSEDDGPLDPDLAIASGDEHLEHGEHFRVGLRSVEEYPAGSFGPLPHLVIDAEEVRPQDARHIARHDPARVLREVEAKRVILAGHRPDERERYWCGRCRIVRDDNIWVGPAYPCSTLLALAAVYSDHPDYRAEWKVPD
jgi:hypothetical protein